MIRGPASFTSHFSLLCENERTLSFSLSFSGGLCVFGCCCFCCVPFSFENEKSQLQEAYDHERHERELAESGRLEAERQKVRQELAHEVDEEINIVVMKLNEEHKKEIERIRGDLEKKITQAQK